MISNKGSIKDHYRRVDLKIEMRGKTIRYFEQTFRMSVNRGKNDSKMKHADVPPYPPIHYTNDLYAFSLLKPVKKFSQSRSSGLPDTEERRGRQRNTVG